MSAFSAGIAAAAAGMWPKLAAGGQTAAGAMFAQNQQKKAAANPPQQPQPPQAQNAINAFNQTRLQLPPLPEGFGQGGQPQQTPPANANVQLPQNPGTPQHPWAKHPLFSSLVPSNFQGNAVLSNPAGAPVGYQQGQYDQIAQLMPLIAAMGLGRF